MKEGQQKIENRTDKLINFMRYWQSGGESEKTSIRVAEKHRQMVEDGEFRGGPPPFGYTLRRTGKVNKRGYETHELAVDDGEAQVVREVFDQGYGAVRIARELTERGYRTRDGNYFSPPYIGKLLRNTIYSRRYKNRGSESPITRRCFSRSKTMCVQNEAPKNPVTSKQFIA